MNKIREATLARESAEQSWGEKCAICGKDFGSHRVRDLACPVGGGTFKHTAGDEADELSSLCEIFGWYDSPAGRLVLDNARAWIARHDAAIRAQLADLREAADFAAEHFPLDWEVRKKLDAALARVEATELPADEREKEGE